MRSEGSKARAEGHERRDQPAEGAEVAARQHAQRLRCSSHLPIARIHVHYIYIYTYIYMYICMYVCVCALCMYAIPIQ